MYKKLVKWIGIGNKFVNFQPPCTEQQLKEAEEAVGCSFPDELKRLLFEFNGDKWLFLSTDEIIERAKANKELLPFFEQEFSKEEYIDQVGKFIFFATNGCGDYYCYRINDDGSIEEEAIYKWEHELLGQEDCYKIVASDIKELIIRYYSDDI